MRKIIWVAPLQSWTQIEGQKYVFGRKYFSVTGITFVTFYIEKVHIRTFLFNNWIKKGMAERSKGLVIERRSKSHLNDRMVDIFRSKVMLG